MNIDDLLAHSRAKFDHAAARRLIKEKYEAKMIFGYNGGMFRCTPEMIAFLSLYQDQAQPIVILDLYENPVEINASELLTLMQGRMQEQMSAWLAEYQSISSRR